MPKKPDLKEALDALQRQRDVVAETYGYQEDSCETKQMAAVLSHMAEYATKYADLLDKTEDLMAATRKVIEAWQPGEAP